MPFPRTWSEELVAEWLHLEGYLVEANMPIAVTPAGGRLEVDVIGARVDKGILDIIHAEVGGIAGGPDSVSSMVKKKFSPKIRTAIRSYFKRKFHHTGKVVFQKMYVATYSAKPTRKVLRRARIKVWQLQEFLIHKVIPTINCWKKNPPHVPKFKGENVQLPDSYWLLHLLDHLDSWGLLKRGQSS